MKSATTRQLNQLIREYETIVKVMDGDARDSEDRAYGGYLRATKGRLQEYISETIVRIAWQSIGGALEQLDINSKKIAIPLQPSYLERIENAEVRKHIESHIVDYVYKLSVDKHVFINKEFVIGIECKAYTENAMVKRILVDFELLRSQYPDLSCYLFQLESQLGGDYSNLTKPIYGSRSTRALQSYFSSDLRIITLLEGERNINNPLHKNFKPLKLKQLSEAMEILAQDMQRFR